MNNKGFTLIELLASITILALVIGLAVPSINGVTKIIQRNHRNNQIKNIEIAASKYAFDTNETLIFVDKLVTEGYITADNEDGDIKDSYNNERLNCYLVKMEKVKDHYNAYFQDGNNYDNDGVCDKSKLNELQEEILINVTNNGVNITDINSWLKGSITLRAYSNTLELNCNVNRCNWLSSTGGFSKSEEVTINPSGVLETRYTFQMVKDEKTIKRYNSSIYLKIDNENPTIYEDEINIRDKNIPTNSKRVTISASDGKGSGIAGYYLGLDTGATCSNISLSYQKENYFDVLNNGNYIICVKDNVGNISSSSIIINNIV